MKPVRIWFILVAIFLLTLSLRLYFSFQTSVFSDDLSYFSLRQVGGIVETGFPIFEDPLSYGGRTFIFTPLFYYILAFFDMFLPLALVGKIVPNMLVSLAVFPIFLISKELTNTKIALFSTFISSFIPVVFTETVNKVTPYSAMIPLMLFLLYFFIKADQGERYQLFFVVLMLAALLTHPSVSIFVFGLLIYVFLMKLEGLKLRTEEIELTLFSGFFLLWLYFLLFKKAFQEYGLKIIWYNLPSSILEGFFSEIHILTMVQLIGVIPFFYGVYISYRYIFRERNRNIFLILSFLLAVGILLWLRLIPFRVGLMFLGIFLILLFCVYLKHFFEYLSKTRFSQYENVFILSFMIAFVTTSFLPTVYYVQAETEAGLSESEVDAFIWLAKNAPADAVILASPLEGHLITGISQKKNVFDSNYLFISDIDNIYRDIEKIYTSRYQTQAVDLLVKYGVTHIYVSPRVLDFYGIEQVAYLEESECFKNVYQERGIKIFQSVCELSSG